jgi:hypothetical protein
MRIAAGLLAALLMALPAWAKDEVRADAVTEPGRSLERALDVILGRPREGAGTVVFVLDPSPSLQSAGFANAFERALARHREALERTALGVLVAGGGRDGALAPTTEHARAAEVVRQALAAPSTAFQNVHEAARRAAALVSGRSGDREVVLVTLENGDVEDDLDATASALRRARARVSVIASEAYVCDSFWVSSSRGVPRGLETGVGDGAFLVLPWGWLFQMTIANETTPSGYGPYALNHLAAETDGRVFLYAGSGTGHRCAYYGSCPACGNDDHAPPDESFEAHRLARLAPLATTRARAGAELARDPCVRALLQAWAAASKEGLVRSRPAVRLAAGGLRPERRQADAWSALLGSSLSFDRLATKADRLAKTCDAQVRALEEDLAGIPEEAAHPRCRAMADLTVAMLHLTHANLVAYAAWCRDVAPELLDRSRAPFEPPEASTLATGRDVAGIGYSNLCLCHGVAPLREVRLPGGEAWRAELDRLDGVVTAFMRRYAHTPYAAALRHQGLARFHFTYQGTVTQTTERPKTGATTEKPTTETGRPARGNEPSSGGGGGSPTTGGG